MPSDIICRAGTRFGVFSWSDGFRFVPLPRRCRFNIRNEQDALAACLYLERRGLHEQAEELLEEHIASVSACSAVAF